MRIVTDNQGNFAICKYWWPWTMYFDVRSPGFWWKKSSRFYTHCWGDKETVVKWYGKLCPVLYDLDEE